MRLLVQLLYQLQDLLQEYDIPDHNYYLNDNPNATVPESHCEREESQSLDLIEGDSFFISKILVDWVFLLQIYSFIISK